MKERLISLAWAAPWMLFMGFPLAYALELPDPTQRAGLIGLCALVAVVNSATWLANPLPARNSFTRPFILSHAALAAATVAYLVYAVSVDTPHAFMLTSYLLVAWVFQAPGRFIVAGLVPVTAIAGVAAYAQGEPLWMVWYLVLLCVFVGVARWRMERSAREHLRRQDAIQRAKSAERARLSTDLHAASWRPPGPCPRARSSRRPAPSWRSRASTRTSPARASRRRGLVRPLPLT